MQLPDPVLLALLGALVAYLVVAKRAPRRDATPRVRATLFAATSDDDFRQACADYCHVTPHHLWVFDRLVTGGDTRDPDLPPVAQRTCGFLRGGWAGRRQLIGWPGQPGERFEDLIGIPDWPSAWLRHAVAVHELFHLMRHAQRSPHFRDELPRRGWRQLRRRLGDEGRGWRLRIREEVFVWWKSYQAAPVGTVVLFLPVPLFVVTLMFVLAARL